MYMYMYTVHVANPECTARGVFGGFASHFTLPRATEAGIIRRPSRQKQSLTSGEQESSVHAHCRYCAICSKLTVVGETEVGHTLCI